MNWTEQEWRGHVMLVLLVGSSLGLVIWGLTTAWKWRKSKKEEVPTDTLPQSDVYDFHAYFLIKTKVVHVGDDDNPNLYEVHACMADDTPSPGRRSRYSDRNYDTWWKVLYVHESAFPAKTADRVQRILRTRCRVAHQDWD